MRTLQRWERAPEREDQRAGPLTPSPKQLTESERARVIEVATSVKYRDLPPAQIVPRLADEGIYLASESSFYRILKAESLLNHRSRSKPRRNLKPVFAVATAPNRVWSWDITYLKSPIRGQYYFLYVIMDVFSRMIVGSEVYKAESADFASALISDAAKRHRVAQTNLILHSDNGGPMKGATMLSTLQRIGVVPSFSRPKVSDDNPFSESLFKTLKYRPSYPDGAFKDIADARAWVEKFVRWYNDDHHHSEINYVTPRSKHEGKDLSILKARVEIYESAKSKNPARWSKNTRKWNAVTEVYLNPTKQMRDEIKNASETAA